MTIAELLAASGASLERHVADRVTVALDRRGEIELSVRHEMGRKAHETLDAAEARMIADALRAFADASEAMRAPVRSAAE